MPASLPQWLPWWTHCYYFLDLFGLYYSDDARTLVPLCGQRKVVQNWEFSTWNTLPCCAPFSWSVWDKPAHSLALLHLWISDARLLSDLVMIHVEMCTAKEFIPDCFISHSSTWLSKCPFVAGKICSSHSSNGNYTNLSILSVSVWQAELCTFAQNLNPV